MTDAAASSWPVSGSVSDVTRLLHRWLGGGDASPIRVRTSGSTGAPKEVVLSRAAVRASATAALGRIGGAGHWVLALPATYVAGLQVIVRCILSGTSPVVLADHPDFASATSALPEGRRYVSVVPTQLHRWLRQPHTAAALTRYDAVLVGGGALGSDLLHRAHEAGVQVVTTYGMSETSGGCVYDGLGLDGVDVALGARGEVMLTGPVLFDGYAGRPDLTAAVLRDGWLHTPDLGRFDAEGRLEVLGRADDVALSGGVNVPLRAVEDRLESMADVSRVAVLAAPDDEWGQRVVAALEPVGTPAPTLEAVRDFVAEVHPRAWAPRQLVVLSAMPMLGSGKVDRQALLRRIQEPE